MRTIGVVTVSRSDYGIYMPILRRIQSDPELRLHLIVSGTHLASEFGSTVEGIERDGFTVGDRVEMLLSSDAPEAIAKSMGLGTLGFAQSYARCRPDVLLVLGDRFETHAAVTASLPFNIPVAHIHGGECTEGAIDDALRHSITKMSHLHFVSTELYARRVVQMGEEPWRVVVSGAPSLDNLASVRLLSREELEAKHSVPARDPFLLVTYHPVTREWERTETQMAELVEALEQVGMPAVFTYPSADTGSRAIIGMVREFVARHPRTKLVVSLGTPDYFSLMNVAAAMVGNSSSGIIEAASFKLPVVNIGTRQDGRLRGRNVIDVGYGRDEIRRAIEQAISKEFRECLRDLVNPYGDGRAAERIVSTLKTVELGDGLVRKRFHEM
ncbi:MAG: UDP-N-acetylglucosamine 2-epimerase (hydrolyzing) [Gemmatimonadetes bacterium]|nr:UDP-N-acetylglucosamine 2-epimerase (hydrolyzing) [Gemmatimonadota bacterium]